MDAISYEYTKQRKQFGLHPSFGDSQPINQSIDPEPDSPELNDSINPSIDNQFTPMSPMIDSGDLPAAKSSTQWFQSINQSISLDCIPTQSIHSINTEPFLQKNQSINHSDGSWPIDVKHEFIDRQRYVRRLINEPTYQSSVPVLTKYAEQIIAVNNTIDCYEPYFAVNQSINQSINQNDEIEEYSSKPPSAKTVCVFRDPNQSINRSNNQSVKSPINQSNNQSINRAATKISWHPESPTKLAVSYAVMSFQSSNQSSNQSTSLKDQTSQSNNQSIHHQSLNQSVNHSYIWDLNQPNHPDATLIPPSPLCCVAYNPRSPDQLIGGSINGQLFFFDLRKNNQSINQSNNQSINQSIHIHPIEHSQIEKSHHDPVYEVFWIQSRTGNEIASLSTDGKLLFWDVRKLKKGYMDCMILCENQAINQSVNQSINQSTGNQPMIFGGCSMEYKSDAGATRFLIGTEQGVCILADRKAKKDAESTKSIKTIYGTINQSNNQANNQSINQSINQSLPCNGAHYGPVNSIQRSPFNVKIFLTCGDWCAKIWMEDLREPIIITRSINQPINQSVNPSTSLNQSNSAANQQSNPSVNQSINQSNNQYITACAWSPTRPGVFFLAKSDGSIDIFDIVRKLETPILSQKISDCMISSLKPSINGKFLAIGDSNGSVTILQLSRGLIDQSNNEKVFVSNLFEREAKREKALEVKKMQARKAPISQPSKEISKENIDPSVNQSINQSVNPVINQSISQTVDDSSETKETKELIARAEEDFWVLIDSTKDSEESKESINQSINQSTEEEKEETDFNQQEEKNNQ